MNTSYLFPDDRENVARRTQCRPTEHRWRTVRGSTREQCISCGASFPCRVTCLHVDCIEARGDELPSWITIKNRTDNDVRNLPESITRRAS